MTNSDLLDLMLDAARAASTAIMQVYLSDFDHIAKADGSPVTIADQKAEAIILEKLARTGIPVLAEESAAAGIVPTLGDRFFVVDPLDGTKEFLKRNGEFTVNIALIENGVPVLGVVGVPVTNEIFYASRGNGVWKKTPDGLKQLPKPATRNPKQDGVRVVASRSHMNEETQ